MDSLMSAPIMFCPRCKGSTESEPGSHTYIKASNKRFCETTICSICQLKRCRFMKNQKACKNPAKFKHARDLAVGRLKKEKAIAELDALAATIEEHF